MVTFSVKSSILTFFVVIWACAAITAGMESAATSKINIFFHHHSSKGRKDKYNFNKFVGYIIGYVRLYSISTEIQTGQFRVTHRAGQYRPDPEEFDPERPARTCISFLRATWVGKDQYGKDIRKNHQLLRPDPDMEPCGKCESCLSFAEGRSYCIHELDAASNNGVDDIKALMDQVRIPPQVGKYSVYIIDEVHMLSQAAFNAF